MSNRTILGIQSFITIPPLFFKVRSFRSKATANDIAVCRWVVLF
jgi:hypothetical protein